MGKKKQYKTDGTEDFDAEALSPDEPETGIESSLSALDVPAPGPEADVSKDTDSKKNSEKESVEPTLDDASASEITPPASTSQSMDSQSGLSDMGNESGKAGGSASESSAPSAAPGIDTTATEGTSTSSTAADAEDTIKQSAAAESPTDSSVSTTTGAPLDLSITAPVAGSDADKSAEAVEAEAPKPEAEPDLAAPVSEAEPAVAVAPDAMGALKEGANKVGPALKQFAEFEAEFDKLEAEAKARFAFARQKATEFVAAMEAIYERG